MAAHLEILAVIDSFAAFARAEAKEALEAADERAVEALNAFLADLDTKKRCVIGQRTTYVVRLLAIPLRVDALTLFVIFDWTGGLAYPVLRALGKAHC